MKSKNWIKAYVMQITPIIALVIYILGFAYYITYYYQFGINIISYITLSEILVSTLIPIIIFVSLSFSFMIVNSYLERIRHTTFNNKKGILGKINQWIRNKLNPITGKLKRYQSKNNIPPSTLSIYAILAATIGIVIPYNIYVNNFSVPYKYFFISILILLSSSVYPAYQDVRQQIKIKSVKNYFDIISFFIIFFTLLVCAILLAIYNSRQNRINNNVKFEITTINNLHYTDSVYNYIGECNSVYFLYDRIDSSTVIINFDNIHDIRLFNKNINIYERIILDTNKFIEDNKKN